MCESSLTENLQNVSFKEYCGDAFEDNTCVEKKLQKFQLLTCSR